MRRLVSSLVRQHTICFLVSALVLGAVISGCSGGSTAVVPTSISITPSMSVSLKFGDVTTLSAQVLDNNGNLMSGQTFVWTTSNSNIATVTSTGTSCGTVTTTDSSCICAGTWSSDFITCQNPPALTPGGSPQSGTATVTVTSDGLSASISALVHPAVSRVTVNPTSVDCLSAAGTQQLTPTAFDSAGNDITRLVAIDPSGFSWTSSDATVVFIDTKGLATAANPGLARVYASISGTSSAPASFITCPVVSITLAVSGGSGSTFSIAQAATQQLTPTVTDSHGNTVTVTSGRLLFSSSYPQALASGGTGLVTGENPGNSAIVASCSPPACNSGLYPVYSNAIFGTTQGTTATGTNAKTTQVLVASPTSTTLVPIDITTGTVGTTLTLPYMPNSLVYSRATATAYLGSAAELMTYDYASATVSGVALIPGLIVNLSNDGTRVVLYDDATKTVTVYGLSAGTVIDKFSVPGATPATVHASTAPDGQTTYVVVGNKLFISNSATSLRTITLNSAANDVAFLLQGSFAYLAGGENNAITARTNCDSSERDVVAVTATPDRIISSADGTKVYAVQGPVMDTVTATTTGAGCPPALTDSLASVDMGQGTVSPTQMFSNSSGSKIYMISSAGKIVIFDTAANTATTVSLSGATATTAALTQDGANLWVGGGADNKVHRIDTSSNTDAQQISVPIPADLVAVRNE